MRKGRQTVSCKGTRKFSRPKSSYTDGGLLGGARYRDSSSVVEKENAVFSAKATLVIGWTLLNANEQDAMLQCSTKRCWSSFWVSDKLPSSVDTVWVPVDSWECCINMGMTANRLNRKSTATRAFMPFIFQLILFSVLIKIRPVYATKRFNPDCT